MKQRELATVLAALRAYQAAGGCDAQPIEIHDIASGGCEFTPMTGDEIDALCERLNSIAEARAEA